MMLPVSISCFKKNVVTPVSFSPLITAQLMGAAPAIDRTAQYARVFIQHSVPRFNNPTGTFDNDQYVLEVIFPSTGQGATDLTAFTEGVTAWLDGAGSACTPLLDYGCESAISNCTLGALA